MVEAVATTRRRANSDGTSSLGPLVLRICGSQREGQIVRLRSAKCTIGSGEHCTLRVRARGVEPLHCVLIRKAARTVVRRWAKDTRLNGASFTDASLNRGDRLSIGPIEFEVLESGSRPASDLPRDRAVPETVSGGVAKRDSLVEHLEAAKDLARKRTEKLLRRLRQANRRIDELTIEHQESDADGESVVAHGEVDADLDYERERLSSEQSQLLEGQTELRRCQEELEYRTKSIAEQQRALESEREGLGEQRQADEARQEALKADQEAFQARKADQEQRAAQVELARGELELERQGVDRAREDLAARNEESDRNTKSEESEHEPSEDTVAVRAELERQRDEMVHVREELDSLREAVGKEREAVETDRERCESLAAEIEERRIEAERQSGIAAQEAAELRVERDSFTAEQEKWEAAQLDAQKQIEQRAEQLDQQKESLDAQREELAKGQANWEGLQAEAEAKLAARAEQLDARERELDERTADNERTPQPFAGGLDFFADSEDGGAPAKSTNSGDLFRQLEGDSPSRTQPFGELSELGSIMRDDEVEPEVDGLEASDPEPMIVMREESESPQRTVSEILLDDPVIADSFVSQPTEEPVSAPLSEGQSAGEGDEEQSIEQYMAGLLARANGGSDATSATPVAEKRCVEDVGQAREPESSGQDENPTDGISSETSSAPQPRPIMNEPIDTRDCGPRARAPEKAEDLVSLRELANLSAQSALDTHARSRLIKSVNAKLAVVAVALATAGVLFWRWFAIPGSVMHYYMGLAVILIAVLWGVQYAALAGYAYLTSGGRNTSGDKPPQESEPVAPEASRFVEGETPPASTAEVVESDSDAPSELA